jgi:hypothetical protein
VKIGNRVADNEPIDETARNDLVRMVGRAVVISQKLNRAYAALSEI